MKERTYPRISITEKAAKMLRRGHVWVFADEITLLHNYYTCANMRCQYGFQKIMVILKTFFTT